MSDATPIFESLRKLDALERRWGTPLTGGSRSGALARSAEDGEGDRADRSLPTGS
jgi:hypothetical protein